MLKFLVDESTGDKLAEALKDNGYDALYCGKLLPGKPDEEIIKKANDEKRVLITNDKDFGEVVFRLKAVSSGVILLRLKNDKPDNRIRNVLTIIKELKINLNKNFIVVSEDKIRIRKI